MYNSRNIFLIIFFILQFSPTQCQTRDAELINQQTNVVVRNNKLFITRSFEIRINNRNGNVYAEVSIPYSKLNKVSKIEASVRTEDGKIIKNIKSSDIKERSEMADFSFYEDNFVKEFKLIHNVYPYRICYSYIEQQDAFLYIERWLPVINRNIPTYKGSLIFEVPQDYKVNISQQLIDSFRIDTLENSLKYTFNASYNHLIESEIYAPEIINYVPMVSIVPTYFKYETEGSFSSWTTFGNWQYGLIKGIGELPEGEKETIRMLISDVEDEKEKIKVLYHYLQDATRYVNVTIETGGLKPYPASYVAENKYGDCKALSNYFKAVLNIAGVPSYYTIVYAGDVIRKVNLDFPSQQFNHVILCVPIKNDTLWLDCTSDGPFNQLGTFTQNRDAFLIDNNNSHFARTPTLSKEDVLETRYIHIIPDSTNKMIAIFQNKFKGDSFESVSSLSRSASESRKSLIIRNHFIETGFELIDYTLIPSHRDSTYIALNYTTKAEKLFKRYGNEQLIGLIPFSIPAFTEPKKRKLAVQINFPVYKSDTLEYNIPVGFFVSASFQNQHLKTEFGTYSLQYHQKNDTIIVIKSFILNAGYYPLSRYNDFYKFVKKSTDIENNSYIVTKKHD